MFSQKDLDYSLPKDILRRVFYAIDNYDDAAEKMLEEINDEEYEIYPTGRYGTDVTIFSSTPSRRTEQLAIDIIERKARIKEAKNLKEGIDNAIARAARTAPSTKYVQKMEEDLRAHILGKIPNEGRYRRIGRRPESFKKYKERTYYFIAVELGYIDPDDRILLGEERVKRAHKKEERGA